AEAGDHDAGGVGRRGRESQGARQQVGRESSQSLPLFLDNNYESGDRNRMLSGIRAAVVLSIFSAVPLLAGCPDPEGRFNEFVSRPRDGQVVVTFDAPPLNEIPDISGNNLLAIKIVFVGSGPLQALVNVTMTKTGSTAKANFHISWLDKETLMTTGTPFDVNDIQISSAGEFDVNIATLNIPAAANPLGIDAVAKDT